jgi:CRP-like cAMP-binding protein
VTPLQYANEYAAAGVAPLPCLPLSKVTAVDSLPFHTVAPTTEEIEALFGCSDRLNVAALCGVPSGNLLGIDAESPKAFEIALEQLDRAGFADTWIDQTPRGGRIWLRTPVPVQSQKGKDIEALGQGKYGLTYPSHFGVKEYRRLHHPPSILKVPSLEALGDALPWLKPKEAVIPTHKRVPRLAANLLRGRGVRNSKYTTRSEAEQAIIASLYAKGFDFIEVLALFRKYPAAGKFSAMRESLATAYLRSSYEFARKFHEEESPESNVRKAARDALLWASATPWPGKTGSTDRAVFCAHASLSYQSSREDYGASARDIAEHAGCQRVTAQRSTHRLRRDGLIELTKPYTFSWSNRYAITLPDEKGHSLHHSLTRSVEGVDQRVSFLLPDAFRHRGLGRPAFEVFEAIAIPTSAKDIADKTGRHIRTVRRALNRLKAFDCAQRSGRLWSRAENPPDFEAIAKTVGTHGARHKQQHKHSMERLRRQVMGRVYREDRKRPA